MRALGSRRRKASAVLRRDTVPKRQTPDDGELGSGQKPAGSPDPTTLHLPRSNTDGLSGFVYTAEHAKCTAFPRISST